MAQTLKCSPTIIFNLETGRSRLRLDVFMKILQRCGHNPSELLSQYSSSIMQSPSLDPDQIIKRYRSRLRLSRREMAEKLGYSSQSMIHHFESGKRHPSLIDMMKLMVEAADDLRGFVKRITEDPELAAHFPRGQAKSEISWSQYWEHFYIQGIRQIMRTDAYRSLKRVPIGYFAKRLGIEIREEEHALRVLSDLGLLKLESGKPSIDQSMQIVLPKDISPKVLTKLKKDWTRYSQTRFTSTQDETTKLYSLDILPTNRKAMNRILERIRDLQDEIHNQPQEDTDSIACLTWLAVMA